MIPRELSAIWSCFRMGAGPHFRPSRDLCSPRAPVEAGLPKLTLLEGPAACAGVHAIVGPEHG
jgi:hypothetical protein